MADVSLIVSLPVPVEVSMGPEPEVLLVGAVELPVFTSVDVALSLVVAAEVSGLVTGEPEVEFGAGVVLAGPLLVAPGETGVVEGVPVTGALVGDTCPVVLELGATGEGDCGPSELPQPMNSTLNVNADDVPASHCLTTSRWLTKSEDAAEKSEVCNIGAWKLRGVVE